MTENMPPDELQTLKDFLWYCLEYRNSIFFRAIRNGKMQPVSLADLTPEEAGLRLSRMIEEGRVPVRVLRPEEIKEDVS